MTEVMKQTLLNAEVIRLHQSTATAPGKLLGRDGSGLLYGRKAVPDGSSWIVALVNEGDKVARLTLSLSLLGWVAENTTALAEDLWNSTAGSQSVVGVLTRTVRVHSTALVKLTLTH